VYISPFEHNAVTRTLHHFELNGSVKLHQLSVTKELQYDLEAIRYQFDADKPDLVVISHASNVCGLIAPVEDIFVLAKRYNSITVVDMAQTAGLVDLNVGLDTIDFAVFAGHKTLYGPTGISGFVMKPDLKPEPVIFGGTGYDSANQDMPDSIPERYEMGTLNISGISGLNAALQWIENKTLNEIWDVEQKHRQQLLDVLSEYPFIDVVGNKEGNCYVGIVSCLIKGFSSDSMATVFDRCNVAVRTGLQCAPLTHKFLDTYPAGTVRFSVSYFTNDDDFEELKEALDYIEEEI